MRKFLIALVLLILVAVAANGSVTRVEALDRAQVVVYPNSMASTGDSITRAFNTGSWPFTDAPANSWSTGASATVNSLYRRFLVVNPNISGRNYNHARSGAKMIDLAAQVQAVNTRQVEYVTILMGANDACTSSESTMTSVTTFRSQFQTAMATLTTGSPNARIYVLSIPNIYNLWSVLRFNFSALLVWDSFDICQSMLANPLSTSSGDVARRQRVLQRVIDFNTQLQQVCAQYPQCRFDNNAVFNFKFTSSDVSTRDYFHPSLSGQTRLAAVAWSASGFAP